MVLDTTTLRVAFAVVASTLGILFYLAEFRTTRSPYSAWWCVSLALFLAGSAALLLGGTPYRWWAEPAGNALLVAGASAIWASARSLRALRPHAGLLVAGPLLAGTAAMLDSPASNPMAGDPAYLALMCVMIGLAARELWLGGLEVSTIRASMAIAAASVSAFYLCRLAVFGFDSPRGTLYNTCFDAGAAALVGMAFLSVASFSMFALSAEARARVLRTAAAQDGLTGLLNRTGFLEGACQELQKIRPGGRQGCLVLADLDHFKVVNDDHGHAAGDTALKAFANACRASVRSSDLIGRLGGEEFILLLPGAGTTRAQEIVASISTRLEAAGTSALFPMPTASYGIISIGPERNDLDELIAAADSALYEAKRRGRNRAVIGGNQ
ncbi:MULTISPECIES: diguanylate cyclase [Arthrobacter]|uniref:Sensor domain-containing diguanylate cyclase n=1 Tax=Arthrobacter terricola TaxID=2547396 RepID=A0A4R5K5J9_9MICC|nr:MULTISPECIES: sensor domain-containing diguanylate cyclase [Arthrobacter]MBT8163733.1 diguanylate cyclase [Arthrobacter sp. GN70]TDF87204.1 sensor domain-containing diguanylate cyclase [Arthrobacter terricola]